MRTEEWEPYRAENEWDFLRGNVHHFNRDMSTLQFDVWCHWMVWHGRPRATVYDPNHPRRVLDDKKILVVGTTTVNRNPSYYVFKKIWTNAPGTGGTYMRQVSTTDPDLKGHGFNNWFQDFSCFVNGNKMVLVVSNATNTNKNLEINGLVGGNATHFRYTINQVTGYDRDMEEVGTYPISGGKVESVPIVANSINVFVTSGTGTPPPPTTGTTIYIKAGVNEKYVTATNSGNGPLVADSTAKGTAQQFERIANADGTYSFKCIANGKYVTANGQNNLVADAASIGVNQKFTRGTVSGGGFSYKAANNLFVKASQYHGPQYALAANHSGTPGAWETFYEEN